MRHSRVLAGLLLVASVALAACASHDGSAPAAPPGSARIAIMFVPDAHGSGAAKFRLNVYRSEAAAGGPFRRVNDRPIQVPEARGSRPVALFVDQPLAFGREYYYYLTAVDPDGGERKLTGTVHATPTLVDDDGPTPTSVPESASASKDLAKK